MKDQEDLIDANRSQNRGHSSDGGGGVCQYSLGRESSQMSENLCIFMGMDYTDVCANYRL